MNTGLLNLILICSFSMPDQRRALAFPRTKSRAAQLFIKISPV